MKRALRKEVFSALDGIVVNGGSVSTFFSEAPEGTQAPFLIITDVGAQRVNDTLTRGYRDEIQINCYAENDQDAELMSEMVIMQMQNLSAYDISDSSYQLRKSGDFWLSTNRFIIQTVR